MKKTKGVFCFIAPHFLWETKGGAEIQCYYLARELIRRGWEVHYIRERTKGMPNEPFRADGIYVHAIPWKRAELKWLNFGILCRLMKKIRADFWYTRATISFVFPIWVNAKRINSGRVIWACSHEKELNRTSQSNPILNILWQFNQALFRKVLPGVDHIILQTRDQQDLLKANFNLSGQVIYNAHPLPQSLPLPREKAGAHFRKKSIMWIGRLQDWKRPELFEALARHFKSRPWQFTAIGKPMPKTGHLTRLLTQAQSDLPNFKFTGELENPEVCERLSKASLLVCTSDQEGFSNTFIEAWARGVPVVSLKVDPDGLLSKKGLGKVSGDFNGLCRDVERLMDDPRERADISSACRTFFSTRLTIEKAVDRLENELLGRPRPVKVLVTLPSLAFDPGGVAGYYNAVLPHLREKTAGRMAVTAFETGSTHGRALLLHPVADQIRFLRHIKRVKPDLVHVNPSLNLKSFLRDGMYIFWATLLGIKVLVFFRGWSTGFEKKATGLFRPFFALTYKKADAMIALASQFKKRLRSWGITRPVHLFTTTVDDTILQALDLAGKIRGLRESPRVQILFLARLEPQKGAMETLEAVKLLLDKGLDIQLTIAGDGSLAHRLQTRISELGLDSRVSMPGYVRGESKAALLSSHHIFCFPTRYGEGMPNSLLEAMTCGMAVVTTPVGGIKDFFEPGKMGWFAEPPDPDRIAHKLEQLLSDRARLCRMAKANHLYGKANFLASTSAGKLIRVYQQVMAGN